jgi:DinB superfamily
MEGEMAERIVMADPVGDPEGYQRELLALAQGRDPLELLAATPDVLRALTSGVAPALLVRRPEPTEWSVAEVVGHLCDAEIAIAFRIRLMLAQDTPRLVGWDQDAWATLPRPAWAELQPAFAAIRAANLALVAHIPRSQWERQGLHEERGLMSVRSMIELTAGHDRAHLQQIEQTLTAVRR